MWLARLHGKHGFQKLFAVKFILPQYAADVRFQQMFLDEARIASGIAHPFVANILDLGEERGILYIVMDWIDGDSLSKLIASVARTKTRIPASIAVRIAADVRRALHAAHELHDADGRSSGSFTATSRRRTSSSPPRARPRSSTSASPRRSSVSRRRRAPG